MDRSAFRSTKRGRIRRTLEGYDAFFPEFLPRSLTYSETTVNRLDEAVAAVHRLGGASRLLPNPELFLSPYARIEAVLSSRIEGTQTTVHDLLRFEVKGDKNELVDDDTREVWNYRQALDHGYERLATLPISLRLIREMHEILLRSIRGRHQAPGDFRETQNWIGPPGCTLSTASFVPPPVSELGPLLADVEKFLHERNMPALITLAMAHYQFEVIHPFLDGNGRIGRLLIPLVLAERQILQWPMLPLSVYFEQHRTAYYDLLMLVSTDGDFTPWFDFFLTGVAEQARAAEDRAVRLVDLQKEMRERLLEAKAPLSALRLADQLLSTPYTTASSVGALLGVSPPTANKAIAKLVELDILFEVTGQPRYRFYYASHVFDAVYGRDGS